MKNINKFLLSIFLLLVLFPAVHASAKLAVGDYTFEFDEKFEADTDGDGKTDRISYYQGGTLVLAAYDQNKDGKSDLWLRYKNGDTVDLELEDTNGDGSPDYIAEVAPNEKAEVIFNSNIAGGSAGGVLKTVFYAFLIGGAGYYIAKRYFGRKGAQH